MHREGIYEEGRMERRAVKMGGYCRTGIGKWKKRKIRARRRGRKV